MARNNSKGEIVIKLIMFVSGAWYFGLPVYEVFGRGAAIGCHLAIALVWLGFFLLGESEFEIMIKGLTFAILSAMLISSLRRANVHQHANSVMPARYVPLCNSPQAVAARYFHNPI